MATVQLISKVAPPTDASRFVLATTFKEGPENTTSPLVTFTSVPRQKIPDSRKQEVVGNRSHSLRSYIMDELATQGASGFSVSDCNGEDVNVSVRACE